MIGATITETDFGIVAVLIVILAVLVYRLVRRESKTRLARVGLFVERERFASDEVEKPEEPVTQERVTQERVETHAVDPADESTRVDWPKRDDSEQV